MSNTPQLINCQSEADFKIAKALTIDYLKWLGMDLIYQGIEKEMDTLNIMYNHPKGAFLYVTINGKVAGGVGARHLERDICEMKRLYIYEEFRGLQLGKLLCHSLIKKSKELGYKKMRLDTVSKLQTAIKMYEKIGFYNIDPYCPNPDDTASYMEIVL